MKPSAFNTCSLGITGLLFAAASQASVSPATLMPIGSPIQYQSIAAAPQKSATIQLAARVVTRSTTNASVNTTNGGSSSITSVFFTPYIPSTAVGATIPAPGTGITPTPRPVASGASKSQGFVRQYTVIKKRATFIPPAP
ncbi:MAG: hypothetical protein GC138_01560 [Gammaproteobacteria bacterium]|nr:hypothetical protein [Gammaproteobacteria bacterium]